MCAGSAAADTDNKDGEGRQVCGLSSGSARTVQHDLVGVKQRTLLQAQRLKLWQAYTLHTISTRTPQYQEGQLLKAALTEHDGGQCGHLYASSV